MLLVLLVSVSWASLICAATGVMLAVGFGTPNLSDGISLLQWWLTLWTLSFISVPLSLTMIGAASFIYDRVLTPMFQRLCRS